MEVLKRNVLISIVIVGKKPKITDRQRDYCGHPFRVTGFFPSAYHQRSVQQVLTGSVCPSAPSSKASAAFSAASAATLSS